MIFVEAQFWKQKIKEFNKAKINNAFALVYIMKTERTGIYIVSQGIQTDLTKGSLGSIACHHINHTLLIHKFQKEGFKKIIISVSKHTHKKRVFGILISVFYNIRMGYFQ